jgi:formylglycine-generating enzyme required for sulfatase activity
LQRRLFLVDGQLELGRNLEPTVREALGQRLLLGRLKKIKHVEEARDKVVENYRDAKSRQMMSEFKERFDTILVDGKRIAIPWDLDQRRVALAQWQQASSWEKSRTVLQCPPQTWIDAYEEARAHGKTQIQDPRINPEIKGFENHRFEPIRVAATTVTREMYHQFDPAFDKSNTRAIKRTLKDTFEIFVDQNTDEKSVGYFPITCTNWYDAWAFAKWVGHSCRLPSLVNFKLVCPTDRINKESSEKNNKISTMKGIGESMMSEVGRCTPDHNGLFDILGNTWEWCEIKPDGKTDSKVSTIWGGPWIDSEVEGCNKVSPDNVNQKGDLNRATVRSQIATVNLRHPIYGFRLVYADTY